jgi:hypothetical protein
MHDRLLLQRYLRTIQRQRLSCDDEPDVLWGEVLRGGGEAVELIVGDADGDGEDLTVFLAVANVDLDLFGGHALDLI